MSILLGAIADDFTGATDLANTLVGQGMPTVQSIGVPAADFDAGDAPAVVVALKSRANPAEEAVADSLAALEWLRSRGAGQIIFKYCSTFDSTDAGNIGPVADALMGAMGTDFTIACPAFPENGRTVYKGHLYVGDVLLSESGMKDHPLTPMTDANLVRVLARQTPHDVGLVDMTSVIRGAAAVSGRFAELQRDGCRYAIVDAVSDADLMTIGEALAGLKLITGGSGIALGLPRNFQRDGRLQGKSEAVLPPAEGRSAVLAGSCSTATRSQVAAVRDYWPSLGLNPLSFADAPESGGVVHLHSTYSVAVSCCAGIDPANALPPITAYYAMKIGALPLVPYFPPGSLELADAVRELAPDHHAVLLANHGPVVAGDSLEDAVYAIEELEQTAHLYLLLRRGETRYLTPGQVADLQGT